MSTSLFDNAMRLKGYGSFPKGTDRARAEEVRSSECGKVKVTVVESLEEYVRFIGGLESSFENPVFYRGQTNANYTIIPNSLRKSPANEHRLIEAFYRYFANELDACRNAVERLALMQHFALRTRFLDISENPLASLYFACVPYKKFKSPNAYEEERKSWGEVAIFQEPGNGDKEEHPEGIKSIESSNASIIANTAFMKPDFSLWHLGSFWKKDANQTYNEKYIDLTSIVRKSLIVRVPQNNPRIKNQRGACILVNANTACIEKNGKEIKGKELTEYILNSDYVTYADLLEKSPFKNDLDETKTWFLKFKKVMPYDPANEIEVFKTDPFDLSRLFYKDKKGIQQVVLIPPEAKNKIKGELERFNITEEFVYPDMDSVANEINEKVDKKE